MIPVFPKFKHLSLQDKQIIESYTALFPPYSDHNFVSLFCWDTANSTYISFLNGNIVIKLGDYLTGEPIYTFIGANHVIETIDTLMGYMESHNEQPALHLIPEICIQAQPKISHKYKVKEDRDNFDYIYSIPEALAMTGNKYGAKRNFVNRFTKLYTSEHKLLNLRKTSTQKEILQLFKQWERSRHKNQEEVKNEYRAIKRLLKHADYLSLLPIGLYVNKQLVGFSINEVLNYGYAMNLFEKADIKYVGIFQYLRYITCKRLSRHGSHLLNHEQDLGLNGLRQSKESYNPTFYMRKYKIIKKNHAMENGKIVSKQPIHLTNPATDTLRLQGRTKEDQSLS